ncbi:hypothetical protein [Nocardia terpenica]|uniref:Uncharacterized protein n=1 Tax=Nocardia terpenica TaxID=455432 RepID=A0A6G9ZDC6_9NOCA|nr:hypothetical protein [Nocardia terpenica]QIS23440.1 hypothetical protein F6W96_39100 [Nocardia terpenica]
MQRLLFARAAREEKEEHDVRRLAGVRHAPGDWIARARIVAMSWGGLAPAAIADNPIAIRSDNLGRASQ